jgi:hypothetical protein
MLCKLKCVATWYLKFCCNIFTAGARGERGRGCLSGCSRDLHEVTQTKLAMHLGHMCVAGAAVLDYAL